MTWNSTRIVVGYFDLWSIVCGSVLPGLTEAKVWLEWEKEHWQCTDGYILLNVLCSITEYFYKLCLILMSPQGKSKSKQLVKILIDTTQHDV